MNRQKSRPNFLRVKNKNYVQNKNAVKFFFKNHKKKKPEKKHYARTEYPANFHAIRIYGRRRPVGIDGAQHCGCGGCSTRTVHARTGFLWVNRSAGHNPACVGAYAAPACARVCFCAANSRDTSIYG